MKLLFLIFTFLFPLIVIAQENPILLSEEVELIRISEQIYIHKTLTNSETYGRFYSNGLLFIQKNEVIIADTPIDSSHTNLIIDWLNDQKIQIKAVVVNHHHNDALGTLSLFHRFGIPSYGYTQTLELAIRNELEGPVHLFSDSLNISLNDTLVTAYYFGEAHTSDNIALWIPSEKVLFGGCMVKSVGAGEGNLEDANISEWSATISRIKKHFPEIKYVVPGHGNHGGPELLDYTIEMFRN